jgi:hypothetical protein
MPSTGAADSANGRSALTCSSPAADWPTEEGARKARARGWGQTRANLNPLQQGGAAARWKVGGQDSSAEPAKPSPLDIDHEHTNHDHTRGTHCSSRHWSRSASPTEGRTPEQAGHETAQVPACKIIRPPHGARPSQGNEPLNTRNRKRSIVQPPPRSKTCRFVLVHRFESHAPRTTTVYRAHEQAARERPHRGSLYRHQHRRSR